ncbi:MAG TPA: beta-propeller fold lactonase family protein [Candidatus Angelobacter sp.]|jgi:6-phosphogluconolactonase (cycloisomerase 2 family)
MERFLPGLVRAAISSSLIMLMAGCAKGNLSPAPTPTPAPGNAFVYTANAGGNSISGFANDATGALTAVPGSPFASPGQPFGLAATPDNKFLYVSSFQTAVVTGFSISPANGSLTPLACSPTAATGAQPLKIAINPAGTFLYTANQVGSVSGFSINTTTGCLTAVSTIATDTVARGLTIERAGQFLYVVTGGGGIDLFSIATNGILTRLVSGGFDSGTTTMLAVKASPTSDVLIATDGGSTNNFRTFAIDTLTGALTPVTTTVSSGPLTPSAIAYNPFLDPTTPFFYIANTGTNNFTSNQVGTNGVIGVNNQVVSDPTGPVDLAVDPTGKFLYVANNGSSNVAAFNANINTSNADIAFISAAAAGSGPESIVVVGHP